MDIGRARMNPVFTNFDRAIARCRERLHPLIILRRNRDADMPRMRGSGLPDDGDDAMPQIWMTYDEIAALMGCTTDAVRVQVAYRCLDRKKSRDGVTRVKLDSDWTAHFLAASRDVDPALDQAIRDLQTIRSEMARDAVQIVGPDADPHQGEFAFKRSG